jgi:probable F420-dependent oxidoreductase
VRFGLTTPVVTAHPRHRAAWEEESGPAEIARIAAAADRLGYHHLTCSEHVAIPRAAAPVRGTRYYDPLATFGFLAGQTARIRFLTHVLVLPYHHPLAIAKRYGTLDRLSGGRLILGVGVGTLEEEFELLGVEYAGRGPAYEDALRALRAAFGRREPVYAGTHHRFEGLVVDPCGMQERIPIWLGGRSPRSLRRALALGDGWDPFRLTLDELGAILARARRWPEWRQPFDVVLMAMKAVDVAELKNRLSHYLRMVRRGHAVLVRDRDKVIARIEPAGEPGAVETDDLRRLADLEARGIGRRGRGRLTPDTFARRPTVEPDVVGVLLREREEGR